MHILRTVTQHCIHDLAAFAATSAVKNDELLCDCVVRLGSLTFYTHHSGIMLTFVTYKCYTPRQGYGI